VKQKFFLTITLVSSILLFSCNKNENSLVESDNGTVHAAGSGTPINYTARVTIQNSAFTPSEVTVHTVTADDGSFDSGDLQPGATFGVTFNTAGPHPYHCKYHSEMTGIVKCVTK
jgi:plastocyanin